MTLLLVHSIGAPPLAFVDRFERAPIAASCVVCGRCTRGRFVEGDGPGLAWCAGCFVASDDVPLRLIEGGRAA